MSAAVYLVFSHCWWWHFDQILVAQNHSFVFGFFFNIISKLLKHVLNFDFLQVACSHVAVFLKRLPLIRRKKSSLISEKVQPTFLLHRNKGKPLFLACCSSSSQASLVVHVKCSTRHQQCCVSHHTIMYGGRADCLLKSHCRTTMSSTGFCHRGAEIRTV